MPIYYNLISINRLLIKFKIMNTSSNENKEKPNVTPYLDQSLKYDQSYPASYFETVHLPYTTHHVIQGPNQRNSFQESKQIRYGHNVQSTTPIGASPNPSRVNFIYQGQRNAASTTPFILPPNQVPNHTFVPIAEGAQIRRTVIPVHIDNQIPARIVVNQSSSAPLIPGHHATEAPPDEAYEVLLRQYERLYEKLSKQEQYSQELEEEVKRLQNTSHYNSQQHIQTVEIHRQPQKTNRKYALNIKEMNDRLKKIYKDVIEEFISKKRRELKGKLSESFEDARRQMKTQTTTETLESITRTFVRQSR